MPKPACDLHTENEGMEEFRPRETAFLRKGKQRRRHGRARMDDRLEVGVVEIKEVAADRIDEGGIENVHAIGASEKCCSGRTGNAGNKTHQPFKIGMARGTERGADEVEERTLGFMPNRNGNVGPTRAREEISPSRADALACSSTR